MVRNDTSMSTSVSENRRSSSSRGGRPAHRQMRSICSRVSPVRSDRSSTVRFPGARRLCPARSSSSPVSDRSGHLGERHPDPVEVLEQGEARVGVRDPSGRRARPPSDRLCPYLPVSVGRGADPGRRRVRSTAMADRRETRTEHDSMGDVEVPVEARWQAQTQRAVDNFPVSGLPIGRRMIEALGLVKAEAARVNASLARGARCGSSGRSGHRRGGRRGGSRCMGRPLPGRRVPDRLGHLVEHERQRGDRHHRHGADRAWPSTPTIR